MGTRRYNFQSLTPTLSGP